MSGIPDDLKEQARVVFASIASVDWMEAEIILARALLAEREAQRERDAKIADAFPATVLHFYDRPGGPPGNMWSASTGQEIAAAIRSADTPTPQDQT